MLVGSAVPAAVVFDILGFLGKESVWGFWFTKKSFYIMYTVFCWPVLVTNLVFFLPFRLNLAVCVDTDDAATVPP